MDENDHDVEDFLVDSAGGNEDAYSDADTEKTEVITERGSRPPSPSPIPIPPPPREESDIQYLYEKAHQLYGDPQLRQIVCNDRYNAHWLHYDDRRPRRRRLRDFQVIRTLGSGFQSKVVAVRTQPVTSHDAHKLDYPADFAVKIFNKRRARVDDHNGKYSNLLDIPWYEKRTDYELRALGHLPWSPWISGLVDVYVDTRNLYLFTELAHCGTLVDLLAQCAPLHASDAQFFFANIVAALEFVHSCGFVHGDVKTPNFFFGANGYLVLGDFGHAREAANDEAQWFGTGTTCYQPPECLGDKPPERAHRRSVDWWGAACILFELGAHQLAFAPIEESALLRRGGDDIEAELLGRIKTGTLIWPTDREGPVDPYLKDLVERMLIPDPYRRYGMTLLPPPLTEEEKKAKEKNGKKKKPEVEDWENSDIRKHAFMAHFPWNALNNQEVLAPFVQEIKPDLSKEWQTSPMPEQREVPFIPVRKIAPHLQHDNRFEPEDENEPPEKRPTKRRKAGKKPKGDKPLKKYIQEVEEHIENRMAARRATIASRPNLQPKVAAALSRALGAGVVGAIQAGPPHAYEEGGGAVEGAPENAPAPNVLGPASQAQAAQNENENENHRPPASGGWRDFRPDPSGAQPSFEGPFGAIPDASGRGTGPHRRPLGDLVAPHPVFDGESAADAGPDAGPSSDRISPFSLDDALDSPEGPMPLADRASRPNPDMTTEEWAELIEERWGGNPPEYVQDMMAKLVSSSSARLEASGRPATGVARQRRSDREPAAVAGPSSVQDGGRIPAPAWDDTRSSSEEPDPVPGPSSRTAAGRRPVAERSGHHTTVPAPGSRPEAGRVSVEDTRRPLRRAGRASPPPLAKSPTGPRRPRRGQSQPGDEHSPRRQKPPSPKRRNLKRKAPHDEE